MIKQKAIVIKTDSATLTIAEMGDIVGNKATDLTLTLPAPVAGLWYRISNVGAGVLTVYYGSALTTLKQTEQCLCLANATSAWFFSKGGGAMTKADIEEVFTGVIETHSHPQPDMGFDELSDVPAYTGNAGKMPKINLTEDGIEFVDAGVAENGIPSGGTTNQLFAKNSDADFDGKWVDAPQAVWSTSGSVTEGFESATPVFPRSENITRVSGGHSGSYSGTTGQYTNSTDHTITITAEDDGNLSFWYKTNWNLEGYDTMQIYIDDVLKVSTKLIVDWTEFTEAIIAGEHIIKITKDNSYGATVEVWLDDIIVPAGTTYLQSITEHSNLPDFDNATKILTKPVNITDFTGKDDYILAYDETNGEFYLKVDDGGGGGSDITFYEPYVLQLTDMLVLPSSFTKTSILIP